MVVPASGDDRGPDGAWRCSAGQANVGAAAGASSPPHLADRLLNHLTGGITGVAAVYQRGGFLPERKAAIEAWAGHVPACAAREAKVGPQQRRLAAARWGDEGDELARRAGGANAGKGVHRPVLRAERRARGRMPQSPPCTIAQRREGESGISAISMPRPGSPSASSMAWA